MNKESAKPVEILTEEELQDIEIFKHLRGSVSWGVVEEIITSHRNLLSANAELSFKNMKYKEALIKVKNHLEGVMHPKRLVMLDCPGMLKTINIELEELNHE